MLLRLKRFRTLAGIVVLCAVLGATSFLPATTAAIVKVTIITTPKGGSIDFNLVTTFPMSLGFSVKSSSAGSTFLWEFGDGTNSSQTAPTHTFDAPCVYDVQVQVTASNGSVTSGGLVLGAFSAGEKGKSGGALSVCPPQGTAGFIPVVLAGGYFLANQKVNVTMDGASITTVTADRGGDWVLNVSGFLASTPKPNASLYSFATYPPSPTQAFTTLEGITASPPSGAPGYSVVVQGRSYPSYLGVQVYLGGVSLGTAQTDGNGTFVAGFTVPYASPLTTAGTYPYATVPQILGSQASFSSSGATAVVTVFSYWWLWWLILAAVVAAAAYGAWRWQKRRSAPRPFY